VEYFTQGGICKEYLDDAHNCYVMADLAKKVVYYQWDNKTPADYDALADDPLLAIRTKLGSPSEPFDLSQSWINWTRFSHFNYPAFHVVADEPLNPLVHWSEAQNPVAAAGVIFDLSPIEFQLPNAGEVRWQISDSLSFHSTIPNLNREEKTDKVLLSIIDQTFINSNQVYYFRYAAKTANGWGEWSTPVSFSAIKPAPAVDPTFEPDYPLSIKWNTEPNTRYWVFASNAIDFVPEIYSDTQIESAEPKGTIRTIPNKNLQRITTDGELEIDDSLCFYRIIAERNGIFSVPSPLIYVYSTTQIPQRTALQQNDDGLERTLFPSDIALGSTKFRMEKTNKKPAQATNQAWNAVQPWIMPLNHAARAALDRIFSKQRVLQDENTLLEAGFDNNQPGNGSQTIVTSHRKLRHYVLKLYLDSQTGVSDWQSWVHRASGAEMAREAIKAHKFYPQIVAPYKWIYPLPSDPAAAPGSEGKNFVLVVDKMPLLSNKESIHRWYKDMNKETLKAIYVIVEELGLVNASYVNNLPWERDLRNVFVDFEYHHVWPTQVENLKQWLRPEMQTYLDHLIEHY
jgi:hypothetical protein